MSDSENNLPKPTAREKFLSLSLESTRKSYYPQMLEQLERAKGNEEQLQTLINKLPARISFIDSTEHFVFINNEWATAYGLKREDIVGQPLNRIIGPENYKNLKPHFDRVLGGEPVHIETSFKTRNGKKIWLEVYYIPEIKTNGEVVGFYGLTIDRTEKKQIEKEKKVLEARLHQAQKMEAIGTLAGGIAHDFNNILSGVFGYSQLAETHIKDPEKAILYIHKIFNGTQRASLLVQQILTFSRHSEYDRKPLRVNSLIKETLKMLRSTIPTNIEIKENLICRDKILADSTQIHQVIMNLCTNAYHAMAEKGGTMTVGLEQVEIKMDQCSHYPNLLPGKYLRLEVSDTGPGIDPKIINRIFDPYFTTRDIGKGTGLGLAVVDGIIKKHNGLIKVSSELGNGASFYVNLPIIEKNNFPPSREHIENKFSRGTERIMVVDDEPDIRDTMIEILGGLGYNVVGFENGERALYEFKQTPNQFDLVITDMTMPLMTGDKMSVEMLKVRKDLPIILCTGYHESFTEEAALKTGIQVYIDKPVSAKKLSTIIRQLLDNPID